VGLLWRAKTDYGVEREMYKEIRREGEEVQLGCDGLVGQIVIGHRKYKVSVGYIDKPSGV